jgi:glutamyl-tRNA reductase
MLMVLGASHHDLELGDLDRLSAGAELLAAELSALVADPDSPVAGAVRVATCNRLELYLEADRFHDAIDAVLDAVAKATGGTAEQVGAQLKVRVGAPVAAHLFAVAAGLDSMVVGEAEISGQVSRALSQAQTAGTVSPQLHALFRAAARTAKKVAATTELGHAGRSVASVALAVAASGMESAGPEQGSPATEQTPPESSGALAGARALIIGTGAYARVVLAALHQQGCTDVLVHSPSGRAAAFAASHQAVPVSARDLPAALQKVDLVVSCSGATGGVLDAGMMAAAVADRRHPLPVIDLALRPDVSDDVRALPGIRMIDLRTVAVHADPAHAGALTTAQDIVIETVAAFEDELAVRQMDPAVIALRAHVAEAVDREIARLRTKYDPAVADDVARAMHRVTQTLLHTPTMRAQELARSGASEDYLRALHTLFGIEIPPPH